MSSFHIFCLVWLFFMVFYSSYKQFLNVLIYLELMVLMVFMIGCVCVVSSPNLLMPYSLILYLSFSVSEAVVGLSLLVSFSRSFFYYSNSSFSLLKF